ncbi:MAG: hypothetical protein WAU32_17620 [Thermoanaerobaculia bacterium]|jgi:hypothetical protein
MKLVRLAGFSLALAGSTALGCGGKSHGKGHAAHEATPAAPAPTPDTTPIEALRTPAGLVLKLESATTPAPSAPSPAPTPAAK